MLENYETLRSRNAKFAPISNFHTHNYLCGHACGTVTDYVRQAVANGYEVIGISDHCACPIGSYEPYMTRSSLVTDYLPQFEEADNKFGDRIQIKKGVEIEYFDGCDGYYKDLLDKLDYLIMGQHEFLQDGKRKNSFFEGTDEASIAAYFENVEKGVRSGYFAIVAHPDLIFYRGPKITDRIVGAFDSLVKTAKEFDVPLELNANGIRNHGFRYPTDLLVDLCKKYGAPVVVSSDCHNPKELCDGYVLSLYAYAKTHGLNVIDKPSSIR